MELTSLGAIIGFGYTSASAWRLAQKQGNRRFMVLGALGTVLSVAFLLVQLIPGITATETMGADAFLLLTIWCLLGFIFYLITVARSGKTKAMGASAAGLTLFALLLFSALMWLGKRLMAAESLEAVHSILRLEGPITLVIIFIGLALSLHIQRLLRRNGAKAAARNPAGTSETNHQGDSHSPAEKPD